MIGTRPEAIKQAPVARALQNRGLTPLLVLTGQQPLDIREHGLVGFDTLCLQCPGQPDPHRHVRAVRTALEKHLGAVAPAMLVVQGDTSSAFGAALAGFAAPVPVAHVEAGLRTYDRRLPWPEEEYRTAIDAEAELLFAPTETAARNLQAEGVPGDIHVTGNTAIDALLAVEARLPRPTLHDGGVLRLLVTCHRRESWGDGLEAIASALAHLASCGSARIDLLLHPNPHVAATMRRALSSTLHVRLLEPCSHAELVQRMRNADLILSDSGGIQEEAPALGTPLLVLRDKTERPEAIATGNAILVGTNSARIVAEVERLRGDPVALAGMSRRVFPFGDGSAAPRIAGLIAERLGVGLPRASAASLLRMDRN